ncbi:MAG: hypothetical protein RQ824_12665 [bacterium]|nr:hypothetical protein [bacterium]
MAASCVETQRPFRAFVYTNGAIGAGLPDPPQNSTRVSLILLGVGLSILTLSIWINEAISEHESVVSRVFAEGLTVAAWVSLWESLATFLINWAPHRRNVKMYERIARSTVLFLEDRERVED